MFLQRPSSKYYSKIDELGLKYTTRHKESYKVLIGPYNNETNARNILKKVKRHITEKAFLVKNQ
jgi:cell division protein FtsN